MSIFLDSELMLSLGVFLDLRCVIDDATPSKAKIQGIRRDRVVSSIHKKNKVQIPDKTKLARKDKTSISNLEKYFVTLQTFKRANPDRLEVQRNARTSLIVVSPKLN